LFREFLLENPDIVVDDVDNFSFSEEELNAVTSGELGAILLLFWQ